MILANVEWIGTCCTFLSLICATQLLITGALAFGIPEVLLLTGSHLSTGSGLIAGFIALPTALRLKTAQISPNMDRIYGYTLCYQQLAVSVSLLLHLGAAMCAIGASVLTGTLGNDFFQLMKVYSEKQASKTLVDNIQYILQCCGGNSYDDWFKVNWVRYPFSDTQKMSGNFFDDLLMEDPNLDLQRTDMIPYSCCKKSVLTPCIHQNLRQLGVLTINTCGCEANLLFVVHILLWFEFFISTMCFLLEIAILMLLKRHSTEKKFIRKINFKVQSDKNWETFSNVSHHGAEITPSSHSQITLNSSK